MSNYVSGQVWRARFPTLAIKLVVLRLADFADDDGGSVFPSVPRLMADTGCTRSTVCGVIADLEASGLLSVVEMRAKSRCGQSTLVRQLDLEVLDQVRTGRLGWRQLMVPVKDRDGTPKTDSKTGEPKQRAAWRLEAVTEPAAEIAADADPSGERTPHPSGERTPTRPVSGPPPVRSADPHPSGERTPTRPLSGRVYKKEQPSSETSEENITPPTPPAGGWGVGWDDATRSEVEEVRKSAVTRHVAEALIDPLRGTLNPPRGVDGPSYVRQLRHQLAGFAAAVLAELVEQTLASRTHTLPAVADLARDAEAIATRHRLAKASQPGAGEPEALAEQGQRFRAELARRLGPDVYRAWGLQLVLLAADGERPRLGAPNRMHANFVRTQHEAALRGALATALGRAVRLFDVVAVPATLAEARP